MNRRQRLWLTSVLCFAASGGLLESAVLAQAPRVILRDWTRRTDLQIAAIDLDGVRLSEGEVIPWDRLERLSGDAESAAEFERLQAEVGDSLFRIRRRLEDGSDRFVGDLCRELQPRYAGRRSRSARLVLAGLVQDHLARDEHAAGLLPLLDLLAQLPFTSPSADSDEAADSSTSDSTSSDTTSSDTTSSDTTPSEATLADAAFEELADWGLSIDPTSGFVATLPPVWFDQAAVERELPAVIAWIKAHPDAPPAAFAYAASFASQAGDFTSARAFVGRIRPVSREMAELTQVLNWQILLQSEPQSSVREIERNLDKLLPRNQALALYWRGLAGLQSREVRQQQFGLLALLRIPAEWGTQRKLAAASLFAAQQGLAAIGDRAGQRSIANELQRRYPTSTFARQLASSE